MKGWERVLACSRDSRARGKQAGTPRIVFSPPLPHPKQGCEEPPGMRCGRGHRPGWEASCPRREELDLGVQLGRARRFSLGSGIWTACTRPAQSV